MIIIRKQRTWLARVNTSDKTPNEAKCMSMYNPEIEELVQKNLKAGPDIVFDNFLTETKEKTITR